MTVSSAEWTACASRAHDKKLAYTAYAHTYENTAADNTRHYDYLTELYNLEMGKADAARRYARWCQDCAASALTAEQKAGNVGGAS